MKASRERAIFPHAAFGPERANHWIPFTVRLQRFRFILRDNAIATVGALSGPIRN